MIGDISQLYNIKTFVESMCPFVRKEERKRSQMGLVLNDMKIFRIFFEIMLAVFRPSECRFNR